MYIYVCIYVYTVWTYLLYKIYVYIYVSIYIICTYIHMILFWHALHIYIFKLIWHTLVSTKPPVYIRRLHICVYIYVYIYIYTYLCILYVNIFICILFWHTWYIYIYTHLTYLSVNKALGLHATAIYVCMYLYTYLHTYLCTYIYLYPVLTYGVATIIRLLKITGLFCKRAL